MWLVWLAILILLILIFFIPSREALTSQELYDVQDIINNSEMSVNDKVKALYGENATVSISDISIINILKDTSTDSETKINNLKLYFVNLVNLRNNDSLYSSVTNKITSDKFFLLNDIINNPDFDDTEKMIQIKSLGIKENTFIDVFNNSSISDDVKIYGGDNYSGVTISSLINEVLL